MNVVGQSFQKSKPKYLLPMVAVLLFIILLSFTNSTQPYIKIRKVISVEITKVPDWISAQIHRNFSVHFPLAAQSQATETPSLTPSPSSTATVTDTTPTPTNSPTITPSRTASQTITISPTPTSSPTRTYTPTPTRTTLPSPSPSFVPLPTIVIILPPTQTPPQSTQISQPPPTTTPTLPDNLLDRTIQSGNLPRLGIITFTFALWTFIAVGLYLHFTDRLP